MPDISLGVAQIAQVFAESVLYGLYLASWGISGYRLFRTGEPSRWRKLSECKWYLTFVWATLLVTGTTNLVLELLRSFRAFAPDDGHAEERLAEVSSSLNVGMTTTTVLHILVADTVWIVRTYVVYFRRRLIIIPSVLLWIAGSICAGKAVYSQAASKGNGTINSPSIALWLIFFWSITTAQSTVSSGLILWRLWVIDKINRENKRSQSSRLQKVMRNVIESGVVLTVGSLFALSLQSAQSNGAYPAGGIDLMLVGIAYNLTIVRSASNSFEEEQDDAGIILSSLSLPTISPSSTPRQSIRASMQWNSSPTSLLTRRRSMTHTPTNGLHVVVTQQVERFDSCSREAVDGSSIGSRDKAINKCALGS